jgi:ribulose-5-phosphate 4-epimerase/fuculose-1-phosphate aldolase
MAMASNVRLDVSTEEWNARVSLAAALRLAALDGWDDLVMAHMSARVPGTSDEFLIIPTELAFDEITASSLHKIDGQGRLLCSSPYAPHKFAFALHMPTYRRLPAAACIIHLHSRAGTSVSMQKHGLLPSSQYALWLGAVSYLDYGGHIANLEEGERIAHAFGSAKVLMMRCHGTMTWGESIPHAYLLTWVLTRACENQLLALAGQNELYQPTADVIARTPEQAKSITAVDAVFGLQNWNAALRRLERVAPEYKT